MASTGAGDFEALDASGDVEEDVLPYPRPLTHIVTDAHRAQWHREGWVYVKA
jgi:hypothetical protein